MTDRTPSVSLPLDPSSPSRSAKRSLSMSTTASLALLKSTTQPTLDELKLSHILNGETCPPISFQDFASFITNKEFSTENLLFVIWFRSYRARYEALPQETKVRVPVPSTRLGDRYRPFEYLDAVRPPANPGTTTGAESQPSSAPEAREEIRFTSPFGLSADAKLRSDFKVCEWAADGSKPCQCGDHAHAHAHKHGTSASRFPFGLGRASPTTPTSANAEKEKSRPKPILHHSSLHPTSPPADTVFLPPGEQPLREEAARAFATFLKKEGSRELGISDELREFARTCLQKSTAPEVFLPVYEEVYQVIETQSLPHFLTYAKANINRPKQIFWYLVGSFDILIGVIIYLILTLLLSPHKYSYRLIRLPSLIFVWFGSAQFYSAYRGFCNQVWGRESMQMKPWEMDDVDDEALMGNSAPPAGAVGTTATATAAVPGVAGAARTGDGAAGTEGKADEESITSTAENLFTPPITVESVPLQVLSTDSSTAHLPPFETDPWGSKLNNSDDVFVGSQPSPSWLVEEKGQVGAAGEISEVAQRQLAIRRATIKIPDASLAFPIAGGGVGDSKRDISPFDQHPAPTAEADAAVAAAAPGISAHHSNLNNLLGHFDSTTTTSSDKKKIPVFGPERVVQDPRIKKLYQSIVRDIIIVASIFGVLWLALILAVPNRGLV